MTSETKCPACGAELSAGAVGGLCLRCLGRLAFGGADGVDADLRRLGDYELLEEIARGGMGVVYRARQLSLNRIVAVKVVLSGPFADPELARRFRTEAHAAAALRHPNIVAVHEVGERDGMHFLSMDLVEGKTFSELVRDQPLPARRAAGYLHTIALAVQHAHERGILHRDLKPSNILLDVFDQPRITDFGLAKFKDRNTELTVPGAVLGSPNFIPPEQAGGKFSDASASSDVYSLGAILYQLLTGRPPFQGETLSDILRQVQDAAPVPPRRLNPSVPRDLETICLKCLQKEPGRRYTTARDLAEDLESFVVGRPIRARPVAFLETVWLWCRRRPALAAMIVALILVLASGLAGILLEWRESNLHASGERQQRLVAEKNAETTRLNLYAADVALAGQVMQQGDFGRARRILAGWTPSKNETDLRGFEWRHLWHLCRGAETAVLGQHEWIVTCVAFSPDGKMAASGGMGGQVKIWDIGSRVCLKTIQATSRTVWSLVFAPDGHELIVGRNNGVDVLDTETWQKRATFQGTLGALSRDGSLLAVTESSPFYWEKSGEVTLWNRLTGERLREFGQGRAVALSPDGKVLAIAAPDKGIRLHDTASGKLERTLPTQYSAWSLHFSPQGHELLSAGWGGEISLWNLADNSLPRVFSANVLNVWDADFSPDGKTIFTTSSDQTIRFWDRVTLAPKRVWSGHESEVWCAAFSPDGQLMISGGKDRNVMLWDAGAQIVSTTEIQNNSAMTPIFSPNGLRIATVDPAPGGAYGLWSVTNGARLTVNLAQGQSVVGFSRSGDILAPGNYQQALEYWQPQAETPSRTVTLLGAHAGTGDPGAWGLSSDSEYFFAIDRTGLARVWDVNSGALLGSFQSLKPPIRSASLSPGGKWLAVSVEREEAASLFDCRAGGRPRELAGHRDFVSGLAFAPDGATLATASVDGTIRLWRSADGVCLGVLPGHLQETTDVAFSPDGRTLASISRHESLKLWHLPAMREVFSLSLPNAGEHLQFSPDGQKLAVNMDDGKVLLLEAP